MIFKQCIVTAANYGPLLDVSNDKEAYKAVDIKLAEVLKKILQSDLTDEGMIDFANKVNEYGGRSMIFPQQFYDTMKQAVQELSKPNGKNVYASLRKIALADDTRSVNQKIGYALTGYSKLKDDGVWYLMDVLKNGLLNDR